MGSEEAGGGGWQGEAQENTEEESGGRTAGNAERKEERTDQIQEQLQENTVHIKISLSIHRKRPLLQTHIITSLFLILLQNSYEDIDRKVGVVGSGTLCFKMNTRT